MDNRTAGKGVEELLVMKGQYKMIFFYNIIWLELEGDEFAIELWCFYLFFFFSLERVMNNCWNKTCLQWKGVSDLKSLKPGQMSF